MENYNNNNNNVNVNINVVDDYGYENTSSGYTNSNYDGNYYTDSYYGGNYYNDRYYGGNYANSNAYAYSESNSYAYSESSTYAEKNSYSYGNTSTQSTSVIGYVRNFFSQTLSQFSFSNIFSNLTSRRGFGQSIFGMGMQALGFIGSSLFSNWGFGNQQSYSEYSYAAQSLKTRTVEGGDNKEVWLANESEEVMINAVNTYGSNILAGNNKDNQIFGGYGNNQMWGGGYRTNDYLFGGEGNNTFWYGKDEGVDLVENAKTGDTINLYNITLGDISNVEITDSSISLMIGQDQGIGVTNSDSVSPNFKLSNGETYNYNRTSGEWQQAQA